MQTGCVHGGNAEGRLHVCSYRCSAGPFLSLGGDIAEMLWVLESIPPAYGMICHVKPHSSCLLICPPWSLELWCLLFALPVSAKWQTHSRCSSDVSWPTHHVCGEMCVPSCCAPTSELYMDTYPANKHMCVCTVFPLYLKWSDGPTAVWDWTLYQPPEDSVLMFLLHVRSLLLWTVFWVSPSSSYVLTGSLHPDKFPGWGAVQSWLLLEAHLPDSFPGHINSQWPLLC
jgi:hypothetical protein